MEKLNERTQKAFKNYLNQEYLDRCQRNPQYSLRAFAKSLSIDPTFLSRLMKGDRVVTSKTIKRLSVELDISLDTLDQFASQSATERIKFFNSTEFSLISKWYFFAILDLIDLPEFQASVSYIASTLDLQEVEVSAALEVLTDAGYLDTSKKPWINKLKASDWNNSTTSSAVKRSFQKQILKKAIEAVDKVDFEERYNSSLSIRCNHKLVPEVKNRIMEFKKDLDFFISESGNEDSVYQFAIAFFPLTKRGKK